MIRKCPTYLVFILLFTPSLATSSTAGASCPRGTAYADGCQGNPRGGNFQVSNFFETYARQSGQTYATRPPWNVAGVDYPIGIPSASLQAGLKDPTSAPLPDSGCVYSSSKHWVRCDTGSRNVTFDGWDFSLHNCVILFIGSGSGQYTIKNSNFKYGTNCSTGLIFAQTGVTANFTIQNSVFDGDGPNYPNSGLAALVYITGSSAATFLVEYSVFLRSPQHLTQWQTDTGSLTIRYSYGEGMVYNGKNHANWNFATATNMPSLTFSYNVGLSDSNQTEGVTNFSTAQSINIGTWTTDHSIFIANKNAGRLTVAYLVGAGAGGSITKANLNNNYFDKTGAFNCWANAGSPTVIRTLTFTSNVNLVTGASSSAGCP